MNLIFALFILKLANLIDHNILIDIKFEVKEEDR